MLLTMSDVQCSGEGFPCFMVGPFGNGYRVFRTVLNTVLSVGRVWPSPGKRKLMLVGAPPTLTRHLQLGLVAYLT
jgi:hypothetical protein